MWFFARERVLYFSGENELPRIESWEVGDASNFDATQP